MLALMLDDLVKELAAAEDAQATAQSILSATSKDAQEANLRVEKAQRGLAKCLDDYVAVQRRVGRDLLTLKTVNV